MNRASIYRILGTLVLFGLVNGAALGCAQATPPPAPTSAPAVPTKAVEPTKAPAAPAPTQAAATQPTTAPVQKVTFPEKGRTISVIVPYTAGGGTDMAARTLGPLLEKELGTTVQVVNRPGAAAQLGLTELAKAKPDGYTLGYTVLPTAITTYLDPERQAAFGRKDLLQLGMEYDLPYTVVVQSSSPYKTLKDLVDAAKAKPDTIKSGTTGLMAVGHLTGLLLEKAAGIKLAYVHFDGSGPEGTALLGGHIEIGFNGVAEVLPNVKSGAFRVLAVTGKAESPDLPGVKTFESQGYPVQMSAIGGVSGQSGMSKEVVDSLSAGLKKAIESDEHRKKLAEMGFPVRYMGPTQFAAVWDEMESAIRPLIDQARQK